MACSGCAQRRARTTRSPVNKPARTAAPKAQVEGDKVRSKLRYTAK